MAPDLWSPDLLQDLSPAADLYEPPLPPLLGYGQLLRGRLALGCPAGAVQSRLGTVYAGIDDTRRGCACGCQWGCQWQLTRYQMMCGAAVGSTLIESTSGAGCTPVGAADGIAVSAMTSLSCRGSGTGAVEPGYQSAAVLCLPPGVAEDCTRASCVVNRVQGACIALARGPCPAPFQRADTWYRSYTETRPRCDCNACRTDGACGVQRTLNTQSGCDGGNLGTLNVNTCTGVTPNQYAVRHQSTLAAGKGCEPGLAQPASPAQLGSPIVICCAP